jgi:hypothetical protein
MGGTYIGPREKFKGEHAMLQDHDENIVFAQFDNFDLGFEASHGWTAYDRTDFKFDDTV